MALWLIRAGRYGEHEQQFLNTNRIYLTWNGLENYDLSKIQSYDKIKDILRQTYPNNPEGKLNNHAGQIKAFILSMQVGDWIVLPLKSKPAIAMGKIKSEFHYDPQGDPRYRFSREVDWFEQGVPRSSFDQDLLYSFGAAQTICQIQRNDAEKRVRQMAKSGWQSAPVPQVSDAFSATDEDAVEESIDLERLSRDQIAKLVIQKFKGHGMARLVEAILQAQGYTTYRSPEGADKGIDILAAPGLLGFGQPRICIQVKSQESPVDRPTLDQLIGTMQNVHAEQGLLVSWGGFKSSVEKEVASQFFRVRLWDQDALIDQLLEHYHALDEALRAEIPLKRIWTIATPDEEA
jgi:restriction system protein